MRQLVNSVELPVRTFDSAHAFLDAVTPSMPGCVVTDVCMPGMSGLDFQAALADRGYSIPVIVITGYADVPMAVRAMKTGAVDFIEKPLRPEDLLARIRDALVRDAKTRREQRERQEFEHRFARVTPREHQVVELVVDGLTSKKIAARLGVSPKTVDVHRAEVMAKMDAHSIAELTRMVVTGRVIVDEA